MKKITRLTAAQILILRIAVKMREAQKRFYRRFLYRFLMRLAHRFNWHYAPANHALTNDGGWPLHWCQWCGMRDFVMPKISMQESAEAVIVCKRKAKP